MSLPFKPHIIALLCSAGLLAAAGTLYVKSRTPETIAEAPVTAQPVPTSAPATAPAQPVAATYTGANRPMGRANRALPGQFTLAGTDGLHLSGQRHAGGAVVAG